MVKVASGPSGRVSVRPNRGDAAVRRPEAVKYHWPLRAPATALAQWSRSASAIAAPGLIRPNSGLSEIWYSSCASPPRRHEARPQHDLVVPRLAAGDVVREAARRRQRRRRARDRPARRCRTPRAGAVGAGPVAACSEARRQLDAVGAWLAGDEGRQAERVAAVAGVLDIFLVEQVLDEQLGTVLAAGRARSRARALTKA